MIETNLEKAKRLLYDHTDIRSWLNSEGLADIAKILELAATPDDPGMVIRSKFKHGQTVYYMSDNKICSGLVYGLSGEYGKGVSEDWQTGEFRRVKIIVFNYKDTEAGKTVSTYTDIPEHELFPSIWELTEYLSKDIHGEK